MPHLGVLTCGDVRRVESHRISATMGTAASHWASGGWAAGFQVRSAAKKPESQPQEPGAMSCGATKAALSTRGPPRAERRPGGECVAPPCQAAAPSAWAPARASRERSGACKARAAAAAGHYGFGIRRAYPLSSCKWTQHALR